MRATLASVVLAIGLVVNTGCTISKNAEGAQLHHPLTRDEAVRLAYVELATSASWSLNSAVRQYRVAGAIFTGQFAYHSDQKPLVFPKPIWVVTLVRKLGGDIIEIYFVHDRHRVVRFK